MRPNITDKALAEYLVSSPTRRQAILERQKYPMGRGPRFGQARDLIVDFIVGNIDRAELLRRAEQVVSAEHESRCAMHQAHGCTEAVLSFLDLEHTLNLRRLTPSRNTERSTMLVADVSVSLSPDVVLMAPCETSPRGAISLLFDATEEMTTYLVALYQIWGLFGRYYSAINLSHSYVLGPLLSTSRRRQDIEMACDEIRRSWATV